MWTVQPLQLSRWWGSSRGVDLNIKRLPLIVKEVLINYKHNRYVNGL